MLYTLFLIQYSFLNGYLLHYFFLKEESSSFLETMLSAVLLSWCLNSLAIYILVRVFTIPFTTKSTILVSFSLTMGIFGIAFIFSFLSKSKIRSSQS